LVRRTLFIISVSIFIVFFVFLGMEMASNSELSEPNFDLVEHGLAAWQQTGTFFSNIRQGDLGIFRTDAGEVPLKDFLREAYVNSLGLLLVALAGSAIIGVTLGGIAALSKRASLGLLTVTVLGVSAPSFFAALLLQQGAIRYQDAFQQRLVSVAGFGWDVQHMLLPVLVLAARPLAYLTRASFISFDHVMQQDYIRTAFSKGLRSTAIVLVHALKNIAVPVFTAVSVSLRFSLSSLPVVEFFFAWPGLGLRLIEAINGRQAVVVVTLAFALGLTFLIVNLLLDIIYRLIDPRLRSEE
jgi:ABC-type dipeptide/oligopeptide/nickel transport system permease component